MKSWLRGLLGRKGENRAAASLKKKGLRIVGRGVPDVSGDADPVTGYDVYVDGQPSVIGGTSAVAPLWAGLAACLGNHAHIIDPAI